MSADGTETVRRLVETLRRSRDAYPTPTPHPRAAALVLPGGAPAPPALRAWAAFDENYPTYLSARRSEQSIATPAGVVIATSMADLLRAVCVDDVADELADDEDTLEYLRELADDFAAEFPGHGVRLEPSEHPDRLLWLPADGAPMLLWYEHDQFERRQIFGAWVAELFEDDFGAGHSGKS